MTGSHFGPFPSGPGASLGINEYADYLGPMLQGDGVNTTTYGDATLQVYADNSGLQVRVRPGSAMIRGAMYELDDPATLTIANNSSTSVRTDRVVLTHNRTSNLVVPTVITGTPGAGVPGMTQNVGGVWQFSLAQVTVNPGAGGIAPGDVADQRQYLPIKVGVCDTRYALFTPPLDGSRGRIFYDKNPAVMDLIVTNGIRWARMSRPDDTGWSSVTTPNFNTFSPTRFRQIGNFVETRGELWGGVGAVSYDVAVGLPHPDRPIYFPVWCTRNTDGAVEPGWWMSLNSLDEGRLQLHPPAGQGPENRNFQWNHVYLIG